MQYTYHVVPKSSSHESVSFLAQMETIRGKERAIGTTILEKEKQW